MTSRPSRLMLMSRMFGMYFVGAFLVSLFFNVCGGGNVFPFVVVVIVSVILTLFTTGVGWLTVTAGSAVLLKNDPDFQQWKEHGGRPYWDSLGSPINPSSSIERFTGLAEPSYTTFTPPADWLYQCPRCGARVEKAIDICWNCNYGANGDSSAYIERWGQPDEIPVCPTGTCGLPNPPVKQQRVHKPPSDWQPMG